MPQPISAVPANSAARRAQGDTGANKQQRAAKAALHAKAPRAPGRQRRYQREGEQRQRGEKPGRRGGEREVKANGVQQRGGAGERDAKGGGNGQKSRQQQPAAATSRGQVSHKILMDARKQQMKSTG